MRKYCPPNLNPIPGLRSFARWHHNGTFDSFLVFVSVVFSCVVYPRLFLGDYKSQDPTSILVLVTLTRTVVQMHVVVSSWLGLLLANSWFLPRGWSDKVIVDKGRVGLIQLVPVTIVFSEMM